MNEQQKSSLHVTRTARDKSNDLAQLVKASNMSILQNALIILGNKYIDELLELIK